MKHLTVSTTNEKDIAIHVSMVSLIINLALSAMKLAAGFFAHSGAMISDGVHSASDVLSTVIVMIGVTVSNKQSDKEHPYGHERMECAASMLLSVLLFLTGIGIGMNGIKKIAAGNPAALAVPGFPALAAAVLSILVKEWMYWYTRSAAKKIHSGALMADAWHHRSDSLSSIGSFAGILGARMGFPVLDPIASVVICIFIVKAAWDIYKDTMDKMIDKSCDDRTIRAMTDVILHVPNVLSIDVLRTRMFGSKAYVDIEISADETLPLKEAHQIAENVHLSIEREFPEVKHCMVHVNPCEKKPR